MAQGLFGFHTFTLDGTLSVCKRCLIWWRISILLPEACGATIATVSYLLWWYPPHFLTVYVGVLGVRTNCRVKFLPGVNFRYKCLSSYKLTFAIIIDWIIIFSSFSYYRSHPLVEIFVSYLNIMFRQISSKGILKLSLFNYSIRYVIVY